MISVSIHRCRPLACEEIIRYSKKVDSKILYFIVVFTRINTHFACLWTLSLSNLAISLLDKEVANSNITLDSNNCIIHTMGIAQSSLERVIACLVYFFFFFLVALACEVSKSCK